MKNSIASDASQLQISSSAQEPSERPDSGAPDPQASNKVVDRPTVEPSELNGVDDELLSPDDEYSAEGTMANVEEMIDEFEWNIIHVGSDDSTGSAATMRGRKRARAAADQIEARLQDELMALEKVCQ